MADRRACKATNKAGGPCGSRPMKDNDYCSAHNTDLDESVRFGSQAQAREAGLLGGRPRNPRPHEILQQRIEENIEEVIRPLFEALDASDGITLAIGGGREMLEMTPDHKTRIAAVRELFDRVYGKPRQAVEHTGPEGGPIESEHRFDLAALDLDERRMLLALVSKLGRADDAEPPVG